MFLWTDGKERTHWRSLSELKRPGTFENTRDSRVVSGTRPVTCSTSRQQEGSTCVGSSRGRKEGTESWRISRSYRNYKTPKKNPPPTPPPTPPIHKTRNLLTEGSTYKKPPKLTQKNEENCTKNDPEQSEYSVLGSGDVAQRETIKVFGTYRNIHEGMLIKSVETENCDKVLRDASGTVEGP